MRAQTEFGNEGLLESVIRWIARSAARFCLNWSVGLTHRATERSIHHLGTRGQVGLHDGGRAVVLGKHRVDVSDEPRNEATTFGAAPPGSAALRSEQAAQVRSGR